MTFPEAHDLNSKVGKLLQIPCAYSYSYCKTSRLCLCIYVFFSFLEEDDVFHHLHLHFIIFSKVLTCKFFLLLF